MSKPIAQLLDGAGAPDAYRIEAAPRPTVRALPAWLHFMLVCIAVLVSRKERCLLATLYRS